MPPTAIVTGASPGSIGLETARALAAKGYAVTLACRDAGKAQAAAAECADAAAQGGGSVAWDTLDLADLASVRAFAARYAKAHKVLDVLILNAGVMACPQARTKDGFDLQFGTNHLGHYVLTLRLLQPLLAAPRPRVVTVSALAHRVGSLDLADPNYDRRRYSKVGAYAASKLANVLFASELAKRSGGRILSHSLHPGIVATRIIRHIVDVDAAPKWQQPFMRLALRVVMTPAKGAATSVYVATSDDAAVVKTNGLYFSACKPAAVSKAARDADLAAKLWDLSAEMTGEDGTGGGVLKATAA